MNDDKNFSGKKIRKRVIMTNTIVKAPSVNLKELSTLFIEMTAQNCNLNCKHCYIDFKSKRPKDFIPFDKIKQTLSIIDKKQLNYIFLTGAEPMLHPDFNHILRLCLKHSSVVINTNALTVNDKKARFLRKVEDENNFGNEIIFMISIDHYIEKENDLIRGRGSYRKAVHAIQSLVKYGFNPILSIVNHFNIEENVLIENFKDLCSSIGFETNDINFKIIPLLDKNKQLEIPKNVDYDKLKLECVRTRTLTLNGVFYCPLLSCDNRGKCGSDFSEYSVKNYLETPFCSQCIAHNNYLFSLDF